jgi:hypothetical protein
MARTNNRSDGSPRSQRGGPRHGRRLAERDLARDHQQEIAEAYAGGAEEDRCAGGISDELDGEGCCPGSREESQKAGSNLQDRLAVEDLLRGTDVYQTAANGSPSTVFRLALESGVIDQGRYDDARNRHSAWEWSHAGD